MCLCISSMMKIKQILDCKKDNSKKLFLIQKTKLLPFIKLSLLIIKRTVSFFKILFNCLHKDAKTTQIFFPKKDNFYTTMQIEVIFKKGDNRELQIVICKQNCLEIKNAI